MLVVGLPFPIPKRGPSLGWGPLPPAHSEAQQFAPVPGARSADGRMNPYQHAAEGARAWGYLYDVHVGGGLSTADTPMKGTKEA